MKSKEEIVNKWLEEDVYGEPLSELDLNECGEIEFRGLKSGFISGYTQCQEDILNALEMHITVNEHDWNRNPQAQLKDFIESLNKKDNESN